jgi:hypothetical protein
MILQDKVALVTGGTTGIDLPGSSPYVASKHAVMGLI